MSNVQSHFPHTNYLAYIKLLFSKFTHMLLLFCFSITIAPCLTEFDISIIDRLSPVLNTNLFRPSEEVNVNSDTQRKKQSNKCLITLESPSIDVRLR